MVAVVQKIASFVKRLRPAAKAVEGEEGFNYLFIMAQVALETGWLERVSKDRTTGEDSKNLFNIKGSFNGESVEIVTREYYDGSDEPVTIIDRFRKYPSYEDSIKDWIRLLKTPRYAKAYEVREDLRKFAEAVHACGFATDPQYVSKIIQIANIIKSYEIILQAEKSSDHVHVVAPGDSLWNISRRYEVPIEDIVRLNNLKSPDHIYPGQKLVVKRRYHLVEPGDTLSAIARRYGVSVDAIVNENGLIDPNRIYPGEELVIPS